LWFPQLLDRSFFESWANAGKKDMMARCREMKDYLLRKHTPPPMDDNVCKAVDNLLKAAREHLSEPACV
jgi:trimethylamine:corrinoid methyltransferase-like protein